MRRQTAVAIIIGVLTACVVAFTTDEILRNVYDSTNHALRVIVVTP